jgi:hypothetical protein
MLYAFLISPIHATCPTHLVFLYFITLIIFGEVYKLQISALSNLLQPLIPSSFLCPNILPSTLLSYTPNLYSYLSMRRQVSHPHQTTGKIMVLYILIFKFFERKQEDRL